MDLLLGQKTANAILFLCESTDLSWSCCIYYEETGIGMCRYPTHAYSALVLGALWPGTQSLFWHTPFPSGGGQRKKGGTSNNQGKLH